MDATRYSVSDNPTIFGKILRKEIPAEIVYEDDKVLAFKDIAPKAAVHVLMIPKAHMACLRCAEAADADLLAHMLLKVNEVARLTGIEQSGYRVLTNAGPNSGQEVPHLHLHILGGEKLKGF